MNNFEQFLIEKLIEAHSPERHRAEVRDSEFHKAMDRKQETPKGRGWANREYDDYKFHHDIIKKADAAEELRAKRLKRQFQLKQKLNKSSSPGLLGKKNDKDRVSRQIRGWEAQRRRKKSGSRGRGGKDEAEFAQDHLDRPW